MPKQCSTTFSKCGTDHLHDPLFLSDSGIDISRTDVVKYPSILKIDVKMRSLFWVPEEIELAKDKSDFQKLSEPEQQIFTETLLRATMLDSIQGRSPTICLLPICSNPELELAIECWAFFETIHSKSYSHIIKNIFPNPSKVFDSLMDISGITDCATSISEYYDDLDRYNAMRTLNTKDYNVFEHKKALYAAITAINALEAIRFYSAFAVFFNYGENSLMQGNAKILQLIARDESLHVGITSQLLKLLHKEDQDYEKIRQDHRDDFVKIYNDVVQQEIDWVKYIFSKGSILGLNEAMLSDYIYYLGRQKIRSFGFNDEDMNFPIIKSNPLPWMDNWLNTGNMQSAPQEIDQINYQSGILDNSGDEDLSDFQL